MTTMDLIEQGNTYEKYDCGDGMAGRIQKYIDLTLDGDKSLRFRTYLNFDCNILPLANDSATIDEARAWLYEQCSFPKSLLILKYSI